MPPTLNKKNKPKCPNKNDSDQGDLSQEDASTQKKEGSGNASQENGQKRMQSYCLRYALRVVHQQTKQCRSSSRSNSGAFTHTDEIIGRVKKRLREEMLPTTYLKTEDPCVENLNQLNKQRSTEIHSNQKVVEKLEQQMAMSGKDLKEARKMKEHWQKQVNLFHKKRKQGKNEQVDSVGAPPLVAYPDEQNIGLPLSASTTMDYKRAPVDTMSEFLNKLT